MKISFKRRKKLTSKKYGSKTAINYSMRKDLKAKELLKLRLYPSTGLTDTVQGHYRKLKFSSNFTDQKSQSEKLTFTNIK